MLEILALIAACALLISAQVPTGTIHGAITDDSGAVVPNANATIMNKTTGVVRATQANAQGLYSAPALFAGQYEVRVEGEGFATLVRDATVEVGNTTLVDMNLHLGTRKDVVIVGAATSQMNYDAHNIQGVIDRNLIDALPLNGRSYMQLASLEPGVTVTPFYIGQFNTLFLVNGPGSGTYSTQFTIDGGNVSDNVDTGSGVSSMNFSPEIVEAFLAVEASFIEIRQRFSDSALALAA